VVFRFRELVYGPSEDQWHQECRGSQLE